MKIRWNILALAVVGVVAVVVLAICFDDATAVIAAGAGLIGGISAVMSKLAEPEPDPSVPASVVIALIEHVAVPVPSEIGLSRTMLEPATQ